ncbi:MAG: pyridoxamine 5'-phosphate oxidase family protein [Haloarculaceae archaeon]
MALPPEVESLVADAPVSAHLATSVAGRPHVAPVWYGYRDGVVSFLTGGKKLENVRANPRVALSIEQARDGDVDWNVTLLGTATVSEDDADVDAASDWIYDRYEDEPDEDARADGGEDEYDYALVTVAVGSAAWNVYE